MSGVEQDGGAQHKGEDYYCFSEGGWSILQELWSFILVVLLSRAKKKKDFKSCTQSR